MNQLYKKDKDKLEQVKQKVQEIQTVFDSKIKPKKNHILFEINLIDQTIEKAQYIPPKDTIFWHEALTMYYNVSFNKINLFDAKTITKSKIIKKENCIYISALNKENVLKILERDFKLKF